MGLEEDPLRLSRRQREILDAIYRLNEASVQEIMESLHDPPTAGAVRRMLNILAEKGLVRSRHDGPRKVYAAVEKKEEARKRALKRMTETFFGGSRAGVMAALLEDSALELDEGERQTLGRLIRMAREKEGS
jgi:predicted transcriptional regulator